MDLLEDLRISLLNLSVVMIYIIHKMLVLLKNTSIFLKIIFLNAFPKGLTSFYSFLNIFFLETEEENKTKDIRNLFILNRTKLHCRNLFRLEKEAEAIKDRIMIEIIRIFLSMKKKITIIQ